MFKEWGFLISEMALLIGLAALLGLLVGWIVWGRRVPVVDRSEAARLRAELEACRKAAARAPAVAKSGDTAKDYDGDGVVEANGEGAKPATLTAPRGGKADDLKQIKGVGPKLEMLCHKLGFYHFDQIAGWSAAEVAWVDANLEGFRGRVSRDGWVAQARLLAEGGETAFSEKVKKAGAS